MSYQRRKSSKVEFAEDTADKNASTTYNPQQSPGTPYDYCVMEILNNLNRIEDKASNGSNPRWSDMEPELDDDLEMCTPPV